MPRKSNDTMGIVSLTLSLATFVSSFLALLGEVGTLESRNFKIEFYLFEFCGDDTGTCQTVESDSFDGPTYDDNTYDVNRTAIAFLIMTIILSFALTCLYVFSLFLTDTISPS